MRKILFTVRNIVVGWFRYLFKKQSELSKERMKICKKCEHYKRFCGGHVCDLCYCFLPQKSEVEDEQCYAEKWIK